MSPRPITGTLATVAAAIAAVAVLCGCAHDEDPLSSSSRSSSQAAPTPSRNPHPQEAPPPLDDAGPEQLPIESARPDPASAAAATATATSFLRAFARTDLRQDVWWSGLVGYFTPDAAAVYVNTDVANVPVHQVIEGSARQLPTTTKYRAEIAVDTDDGTYTVVLLRAGGQWLVDRALPPR